jgi:G3E family GTPase
MTRLPLTVITGFLGSGKTTLIRTLLKRPELRHTAVIVNEFGEIGLDHELIESSEEDLIELSTGCLCCAMRGDLTSAVERLTARRAGGVALERIVLETTGLAEPAPILQSVLADVSLQGQVFLDRVVVTVDALTGMATLDAHDVSRKQAALADLLLLTKTDLDGSNVAALESRLATLNPHAELHRTVFGDLDPEVILAATPGDAGVMPPLTAHHQHGHDDITSVSLTLEEPLHAVTLTLFLQCLADACGADLLRVKGIIRVAEDPDSPAVVHGVQHVFHPIRWLPGWPPGPRHGRLVLIGRGLRQEWVEALLATIEDEVCTAASH